MGMIAAATILSVFCLASSKALLSDAAYQRKVIKARKDALTQLDTNAQAASTLAGQYKDVFQSGSSINVLGGLSKDTTQITNADGSKSDVPTTPPNGTNARIVLDALPTSYDYPALLTSVSEMLDKYPVTNPAITSTDESATIDSSPTPSPQLTTMPLNLTVSLPSARAPQLIQDFERSIRPFDISKMGFTIGADSSMTLTVSLNTYFQPAKSLVISNKAVK
jgi:hypothetical protein